MNQQTFGPRMPRLRPIRNWPIHRRLAAFLSLALLVGVGIYLPVTALAPLAPTPARLLAFNDPARAAAAPQLPSFGASAVGAIGYPEALVTAGSKAAMPIASISKIITTLVVLEAKPLAVGESGPMITFTAADAALTAKYVALNGETKPLVAGSVISQLDLIRVALVASANNYAEALSGWAYHSSAAFQIAVTAWLSFHGLTHTTIVEPTGINPGNVSTAAELVEIGKLALANPVVAAIVATSSMTLAGLGTLNNTNSLLGQNGVEGIKTGTLNGTSDLLFSARYRYGTHSVTVVGAVIGGPSRSAINATVTTLLAGMKAGFHEVMLARPGQPFASFTTDWSQRVSAVSRGSASILVWGNTPVRANFVVEPARVGPDNASAGQVTFTGGRQVVKVPLVLDHPLVDPGTWWRLQNPAALAP